MTSREQRVERAPKKYTILILPHSRARFRKIHVTRGVLVTATGVLLALVAAAFVLPHQALTARQRAARIAELEHDKRELMQDKQRFDLTVDELHRKLARFENQAVQIAAELGIENLPSAAPGAGGGIDGGDSGGDPYSEDFEALSSRARSLDDSFEQIDEAWQERVRMLASTPSLLPVRGWFSHGYGWRKDPFTGKRAFHRGIDIVAPAGTPILASADGVVTAAGRDGGYGKKVDLSHGYGYLTRYAHMSEVLVRPGQRITRGETIGRVGSTGRSTSPHLHYEVFRDGRRINPWKYLGEKGS